LQKNLKMLSLSGTSRIDVIGFGTAGHTCASHFSMHDLQPTVVEKSHGLECRLATRVSTLTADSNQSRVIVAPTMTVFVKTPAGSGDWRFGVRVKPAYRSGIAIAETITGSKSG